MIDKKKLMSDLEGLTFDNWHMFHCDSDVQGIAIDALELLKEQDAVTIKKTKEHGFGVYGGICPKCKNWIQSSHSYCGFCGQAVKWE